MYKETIHTLNEQGASKSAMLKRSPLVYLLSAVIAGSYVGIGALIMFSLGAPLYDVQSPILDLVVGSTFGIALIIILIGGSDLFTGNNMIMTTSTFSGGTTWKETLGVWGASYFGNAVGALLISLLVLGAGIFQEIPADHYMFSLAAEKISLPWSQLFFQGILCNWIVCLAIWLTLRTESDTAKIIMVLGVILAFVASGFEHSIANMSILGMAWLHDSYSILSFGDIIYNLIPVTIGNMIGGAIFVAGTYLLLNRDEMKDGK
ncbi:formate/nitrite transporter family protein [Sinobaca sp. H24]|uniref:formate/nitrite transporter family protein n=1 Tax=Sinobaca sp. H24 TaxID=2923376 RepID=UPI002079EFFA|nr:formate/nitrite transporter family protein [Sinobaca sp. H24]